MGILTADGVKVRLWQADHELRYVIVAEIPHDAAIASTSSKHGSWLNIAETELSTMAGQCLDRRIPDREALVREVAAWEADRNALGGTVNWQFTTEDARIKLERLYPSIDG